MRVAVIYEGGAPIGEVCANIRQAGFTGQLDVFVQPTAPLDGLNLDGVFIRRLKTYMPYNDLWRNIIRWWIALRSPETHMCIFKGGFRVKPHTAAILQQALDTNISWGLISLFAPESIGFYFSESSVGWNGISIPIPLVGNCLSKYAADVLSRDPLLWETPPDSPDFNQVAMQSLSRRALIQAVHYPSLMTGPTEETRGLHFEPVELTYSSAMKETE